MPFNFCIVLVALFPIGYRLVPCYNTPVMAKTSAPKRGIGVIAFLREARNELRQVTWPTRATALRLTLIVIGISVAAGIYLGSLDYLFTQLMGLII